MFYLFANCNFVPDHYDDWQAGYDDLATYVWANEPTTKTYYFGIPLDYAHDFSKTTSMLAFEVYGCRDDLYKTHFSSPAMGKFLSVIPAHTTADLDLSHYEAVGGFLDSDGDRKECAIMLDIRISCKSGAGRANVIEHMRELAPNDLKSDGWHGSGVLTLLAFSSLDNDTGARVFARFESREAMELFVRRHEWLAFCKQCREDIASLESRAYLPNGKGWLHRGGADIL